MKGSGKILVFISAVTFLLVLYVHTQISLFRASYTIDTQVKTKAKKTEEYRFLKFEVDQMRAPRVLEEKMSRLDLDLAVPDEIQFVRMPQVVRAALPASVEALAPRSFTQNVFGFLERWVKVAQAKTEG